MKFFPIALLLPLAFNGLKGLTLSQERPDKGFDTAISANISGLYQGKSCCNDDDTTSFTASHEYQFNSGEANSDDSSHKFACIIANFLKSLTNLVGCNNEEDGTLTVRLKTTVSQTEGENCSKVQKCVLPTITIKPTDCKASSHSFCGKCDQTKNLEEKADQGDLTEEQNIAKRKPNSDQKLNTSFKSSFSTSQESSAFSSASDEEKFLPLTIIGDLGNFEPTQTTPEQTVTNIKSGLKHRNPTTSFIKSTDQSFSSSSAQSTVFPNKVILLPVSVTRQPTRDSNLPQNDNSFSDLYSNREEKSNTNEEINVYERQRTSTTNEGPQRIPFYRGVNPVTQAAEPSVPSDYLERQNELNRFEQGPTTPLFEKEYPQVIQPKIHTQLEKSSENRKELIGSLSQQTETSPSRISSKTSSTSYSQAETDLKSETQRESVCSDVNQGNEFPLPRQLQRQTTDPIDKKRSDSAEVFSHQQTSTTTLSESAYKVTKNVACDNPIFNDSPNQKFNENISEQRHETGTQVPQPQPSLDNSYYSDQLSTKERELNTYPKGLQTSKTFEGFENNFQPPVNHPPLLSLPPKPQTFATNTLKNIEGVNDYPPPIQIHPGHPVSSNTHFGVKPTSSPLDGAYPQGFVARNSVLNGQSEDQLIAPLIPPNLQKQTFSPDFGLTSLPMSPLNQSSFEKKENPTDRNISGSLTPVQRPLINYSQRQSDEQFQNSTIPHFLNPYDSHHEHPPHGYPSQRHFENNLYNNYPRFNPQEPRPGFSQTHHFPGQNVNHFPPYSQYNRFDPQHPFPSPNQFHSGYYPGLEKIQRYPYRDNFFNDGNRHVPNERPNFHYNPSPMPGTIPEYLLPSQPYSYNFRPFRNEPEYVLKHRGVQFRPYGLQKGQLENENINTQMLPPPHVQNFESEPHYLRNHYNDGFGNNHPFRPESPDFHPYQVPDNQRMPPLRNPQEHYPYSFSGHFLNNSDHQVENQYRRPSPFYPPSQPGKELSRAEIQNTARNQEAFQASDDYKKVLSGLSSNERLAEFDTQFPNQNKPHEQLQNAAFSSRNQNLPEPNNVELNTQAPGQMPDGQFRRLGFQQIQAQPQGNPVLGPSDHQLNIPPLDSSRAHVRHPFPQQQPSSVLNSSNQGGATQSLNFQSQSSANFMNSQNPERGLNPPQNHPPGPDSLEMNSQR